MFKYVKYEKVETEFTVLEFRGGTESVEVNHFDGEIVSLKADSEADIDTLIASQPAGINAMIITKEEFKTLFQNSEQYRRILKQVDDKFREAVSVLTSQYELEERETWATQVKQAISFKQSGNDEDAPFLKTLAERENDTVDSFADAILENSNAYEAFMADKLADKRAHKKELMSEIGL